MSETGPVMIVDIKEKESIELIQKFIENIRKQTVKDPVITEAESKKNAVRMVNAITEMVNRNYRPLTYTDDRMTTEQIIESINSKFLIIRR